MRAAVSLLFLIPALAGCGRGRGGLAVERDAGESEQGGAGGTRRLDAGDTGTGGMAAVEVPRWQPADPCTGTSALRRAQSAPPSPTIPPLVPPPVVVRPPTDPGPQPLRRLTRLEYVNTLRDLLGVAAPPGEALALDLPSDSGFTVGAAVTAPEGRALLETALAAAAGAGPAINQALPRCCAPAPAGIDKQEACASTFIERFGLRAFRRPLSQDEGTRLLALYRGLRDPRVGKDFLGALQGVVAAALQTPQFLYHRELGPFLARREGRSLIRLGPYEVASRLSYLFWASMPDDDLFAAAAGNRLSTATELETQARRLLASPRSRAVIEDFHLQWLQVADLEELSAPAPFSPELARSMLAETREFVSQLFLGADHPTLAALLTSPKTFVDGPLAAHYGLPPVMRLEPVQQDPGKRAGVLTQASVLTAHGRGLESDPIQRGLFVMNRLVCIEIPPPPPLVPAAPAGLTRESLAVHSMNPACVPCHQLIDPPGLSFENYDGLGRHRTASAGGQLIDATGAIRLTDLESKVKNAVELAQAVAKSRDASACLAQHWLRYFLRRPEDPREMGAVTLLAEAAERSNDLREMLLSLTRLPSFQLRLAGEGEMP